MKRAALDRPRSVRNWRRRAQLDGHYGHTRDDLHAGHFRKGMRFGGCGSAACWVCHYSKLAGYPTLQDARSRLSFREQLAEFVF